MLEKLVASLLVPYLSKYVEDIDEQQLSISLWNGKASLHDLILKPSVLNDLLNPPEDENHNNGPQLPISVHRGLCKNVSLTIPYNKLYSQPVVMEIGEVLLTVCGGTSSASTMSKSAKWDHTASEKEKKLDSFELERKKLRALKEAKEKEEEEASKATGKKSGLISRLGEIVINNIIIKIDTVHIRYEDSGADTVIGAILGGVHLLTVDGKTGEVKFTDPTGQKEMFKRFEFEGIQIYCDDERQRVANKALGRCYCTAISDWGEWYHAMRQRVRGGCVEKSTVFGPVSGSVDMAMVFKSFIKEMVDTPYVDLHAKLASINTSLTRDQYTTLVKTVSTLTNWTEVSSLTAIRPKVPVKGNAKVWWRFVGRAVRQAVTKERSDKLLAKISEVLKPEYQALYSDVVHKVPFNADKERAYRFACRFMTVPDMVWCRRQVYAQLAQELKTKRKDTDDVAAAAVVESETTPAPKKEGGGGWFGWLRGGKSATTTTTEEQAVDEETKTLLAIEKEYGISASDLEGETDGKEFSLATRLPKEYCWFRCNFELPLVYGGMEIEKGCYASLKLYQVRLAVRTFNQPNSAQFHFCVQNATLSNPWNTGREDMTGRTSSSHHYLQNLVEGVTVTRRKGAVEVEGLTAVQGVPPDLAPTLRQIVGLDPDAEVNEEGRRYATPLIDIAGAIHPVEQPLEDCQLDVAIRVKVFPLRVVLDPTTIEKVALFFRIPKGVDMSHITSSTIRAANAVQSAAAQEIKQSMSAVKGIFISVDVSAPIIVLPKSITSTPKETTLYISLGCVKFKTKPLPEKEKRRRIQSKEEKEENLYYSNKASFDRFFIEMTTVENAFLKPESGFMILPEVSVSANILQKIDDANLTRDSVIVRLRVPKLRLQLSVYQVFLLTDMIEAWVTYLRDSEEDAARFNPTVPLASNSSPLYPDCPGNSSADDGGDSAPGYATHVSPTTGSPPAVQRSEHSARISALDGGNPVMRLELLVEQLGLDVFEGEGTLTVTQPPRFSLSFAHLEFILAKRENIMKIVLHFEHPTVLDYTAKEHPILSAPSVEVEVTNPKGQPVAVGVVAKPGVHFCLGTPFMELMETIMDIVNLILATKDYASAYEAYVPYVKESANEKEVCDDLLEYQLGIIKASNEAQDYRIVDISLLIEGKATVHFMNRGPNDTEDFLFASVDLNDFELYLKKNNVTLGLTGCIASVEASVCDSSELLEEYRLILSGSSTNSTNQSSAFSGSATSNPTGTSSTLKHSSDARSWSSMQSAPHVGFSYQTSRPVMPIFGQDENGKDVITNAAELRYSRSMELELGSSTLCVDVHTIMVIKNYFLSGFFSRITFLTDRTLYNGDSKKRAAPRPGPRLLLGMRVVANDVNIVIPLDARENKQDAFCGSVGYMAIQNNLRSLECQERTNISLSEIGFWREQNGTRKDSLLSETTAADIVVCNSLAQDSAEPMLVNVTIESVDLLLRPSQLVDLCTMVKRNVTLTGLTEAELFTPPLPWLVSPLQDNNKEKVDGEIISVLKVGHLTLACTQLDEEEEGGNSSSAAQEPAFKFVSDEFVLEQVNPSNHLVVYWKSLELLDVRGEDSSSLVQCDVGVLELADTLTTRPIVLNDFGVRRNALKRTAIADEIVSGSSSENTNGIPPTFLSQGKPAALQCAAGSPVVVEPSTALLTVSVLTLEFTLKRFAVSDQWLSIYDFFCNESVMNAFSLPPPPCLVNTSGGNPAPSPSPAPAASGFRCTITTPSVTIPFLTTGKRTIMEARVDSVFIDTLTLPEGPNVVVKVKGVEVRDCVSGKKILWKRKGKGIDFNIAKVDMGDEATPTTKETPSTVPSGERETIDFSFKGDPVEKKNRLIVALGTVDLFVSIPILYGLLDYCVSPCQPIAKISRLGVMREQRARMALLAKEMTNENSVSIHVQWYHPRLLFAVDASNPTTTFSSGKIEARLGEMNARISLDNATPKTTVSVKIDDVYIPDILDKCTGKFSFTALPAASKERVELNLEKTVVFLYPGEVERLLSLLQKNLLLPRDTMYYSDLSSVAELPPDHPSSPTRATETPAPTVLTPIKRETRVLIKGLQLQLHDVKGMHTHTAVISQMDFRQYANQDMRTIIPAISVTERFTNRPILQCVASSLPASILSDAQEDSDTDELNFTTKPAEEGGEMSSVLLGALLQEFRAKDNTMSVGIVNCTINMLPRGIGSLVNTLLSIKLPVAAETETTEKPPSTTNKAPEESPTNDLIPQFSQTMMPATEEPLPSPEETPARRQTLAPAKLEGKFLLTVESGSLVFLAGDQEVAVGTMTSAKLVQENYSDKSSILTFTVSRLNMTDHYSKDTLYKDIVQTFCENSNSEDKSDCRVGNLMNALEKTRMMESEVPSEMVSEVNDHVVYVRMETYSEARNKTLLEEDQPFFSRKLDGFVGDLYVVIIPGVTQVLYNALMDIRTHITEGNRTKAYDYVSDKAAETLEKHDEQLLELSVKMRRVVLYVVHSVDSVNGILVSPGYVVVGNALVQPDEETDEGLTGGWTESLKVEVDQVYVSVLDENIFPDECVIEIQLQRTVKGFSVDPVSVSEFSVYVPSVSVKLTEMQTLHLMDFVGIFNQHSSELVTGLPTNSSQCSGASISASQTIRGGTALASAATEGVLAVKKKKKHHYAHVLAEEEPKGERMPKKDAVVQPFVSKTQITVSFFEADISDVFRIRAVGAVYEGESRSGGDTKASFTLDDLCFQHVGAHVEAEGGDAKNVNLEKGMNSTYRSFTKRRTSRVDDVVDFINARSVVFLYRAKPDEVNHERQSIFSDATIDLSSDLFRIAVSPTILFDTREHLYLPFFYRVLQVPVDPIPVLELQEANTILVGDIALDDKHVLVTANPARCCFHLDLNGHRLIFSGMPTACIVLQEGCELTVTNGTIFIPGMYSLSSYVGFAPGSALLTAANVKIEKEFQNIPNDGFALIASRPPPEIVARLNKESQSGRTSEVSSYRDETASRPARRVEVTDDRRQDADKYVRERSRRLSCTFSSSVIQLQVLSEEIVDFSVSLVSELRGRFTQETENNTVCMRNTSVQFFQVRSGENEEHILLPTNCAFNISGVDNVSIAYLLDSLELCIRATLIRSIIELGKSFSTVFFEEATVQRVKPTIEFEDAAFKKLFPVASSGKCEHCGQLGAYLGESTSASGHLCYRCCTGKDSMPAMDVRLEVPIVDVVLSGSRGDLQHYYMRSILVSVDTNMDVAVNLKGALFNFNTRAAVWEPFVEAFELAASGSLITHDYTVGIPRFDVVVSPHSVKILRRMINDYNSLSSIQHELRQQFRKDARMRNKNIKYAASGVYGDSTMRADSLTIGNSRTFNEDMFNSLAMTQTRNILARSAFDLQKSINSVGIHQLQKVTYARLHVNNYCNATIVVDHHTVPPHGSMKINSVFQNIEIMREQPLSSGSGKPHILSLCNPPLHATADDFIVETHLLITKGESRRLKRGVHMNIFPLHCSQTIVCLENNLRYSVQIGDDNMPALDPSDRRYLAPNVSLSDKLWIRPISLKGQQYHPATKEGGASTTYKEALSGRLFRLICKNQSPSGQSTIINIILRQETMRGGIPTFVISLEPLYSVHNKLPYAVNLYFETSASLSSDATAKGKIQAATTREKLKVEEFANQDVNVAAGFIVEECAMQLEIQQPGKTLEEVYTSDDFYLGRDAKRTSQTTPIVVLLKSSKGREMYLRVILTASNKLVITTPFLLLNHTPLDLTLRECTAKGEITSTRANANYYELPRNMNKPFVACPKDYAKGKEDFFVSLYTSEFSAKAVPLHVQQRGLILMMGVDNKGKAREITSIEDARKMEEKGMQVIHLAYLSKIQEMGYLLVEISPRWVVVNRSAFPLYVSGNRHVSLNAAEVQAAAQAVLEAKKAEDPEKRSIRSGGSSTALDDEVHKIQRGLEQLVDNSSFRMSVKDTVLVEPDTAVEFYRTQYHVEENGYHLHITPDPTAPLYGVPVNLEVIHNEVVVCYRNTTYADAVDSVSFVELEEAYAEWAKKEGEGEDEDDDVLSEDENPLNLKSAKHDRDRFVEVSLVSRDPYTYVVIETPQEPAFLLLNRTSHIIGAFDGKYKGRPIGLAAPGCQCPLMVDTKTTSLVGIALLDEEYNTTDVTYFDVSRPMTKSERAAAPLGLQYELSYASFGQVVVQLTQVESPIPYQSRWLANKPPPINLLANLSVMTVSLVLPNRDIIFGAITDVRFSWDRDQEVETFMFSVQNYQVDNQTEISPRYESCILALRRSSETAAVAGKLVWNLTPVKSLMHVQDLRLDFCPVAVRVSDALLVDLFRFFGAFSDDKMEDENTEVEDVTAKRPHTKFTCPTEEALFFRAPKSMDFMTTRLIVERFIINPILLRLWFFRDDSGADFIRESIKSKEAAVFSMLIGSCDDIKVVTPGIACVKRSNRLSIFTEWLARSYMDGLFAQIKGILLQYASSLPLIGAPVKLFSGISGGAVRLFRDPVDGLTTTNNGFAIGLAKGSSKFAQGFASGSLGAFSNLTDAGARFFSLGTGTSEKQRKSQNTLTAIASGFKGIVQKPREGAAESGTSGFLKGISQGLLGVVTNPISGALNDISHATGTLANMVNDTYVPNTRRLRGIRSFYANGGVAPWKSLISVYEYERGTGKQHDQWDGEHLMSGIDGPQWYPSARDEVTFGNEKKKVPKENWVVNRFDTDFDGWSFSNKYYGRYSPIYTDSVRVRRKRWAALVKPLPHSPIATFLKICPGMAKGEGRISRSASLQFGRTASSSSFQDFTKPGEVMILTATETHLDNQKRKRNHSRTSSQFFTDDDAPTHHHKRSSSWSPGARIGVKHEWARTDVKLEDGDGKCDGTKGVPLLKPCAPAEQMSRSRKKEEKAIRRSQSTSAEQQEYDTEFTNESKRKSKSKPPSRSNSPKPEFFPPLKAYEESGPVLSREESSKSKSKGSRSPRADTKDSKSSGPSPVFVAPPSDQSVEIYEHEKMNKNGSWEKRHLPSNYAVCQFTSGKRAKNRTSIKPPSGYRWMGNWSIVAVDGCDADGWEMVKGEKGIRRRKWKRTLIKK